MPVCIVGLVHTLRHKVGFFYSKILYFLSRCIDKLLLETVMKNQSLAMILLSIAVFLVPLNSVKAETIFVDKDYYEKNLQGQCIFGYSERNNAISKIVFESATKARFLTESYIDVELKVSFSNGNLGLESARGGPKTYALITQSNQSFVHEIEKKLNKAKDEVFLGDCKTNWKYFERLGPLPLPASTAAANTAPVKVEKDEIAALEKKLAALKQKSARKEEYQKMRALLDQKLKEVQGQIQMLEQEYKDVLN